MAITKALGGERLGSGNKMNVTLHGFNRSSHNIGSVLIFVVRSMLYVVPFRPMSQKYGTSVPIAWSVLNNCPML